MMISKFRLFESDYGMLHVNKLDFKTESVYFDVDGLEESIKFGEYNSVLMQSTGLTDKNDNEIYIDDILKDKNGYIYRMDMNNYDFVMRHKHLEFEILGNVYENAEILGV